MTKRLMHFLFRTRVTPTKTPVRILLLVLVVIAICVTAVLTIRMDRWVQAVSIGSILLSYYLFVFICWRRDRRAAESEDHQ